MTNQDFNRLMGLLAKLEAATAKASTKDGSFKKYHNRSIDALKTLPDHLKHLEEGLRTAKFLNPDGGSN